MAALPLDTQALRSLWSAQQCPTPLLPWLSWTLSVESWHEATSVEAQRNLILASNEIHRHKGTRWAIRTLLRALGFGEVVFSERIGGLPRNGTWHRDGEYTRASLEETWATYRIVFSRRITNAQADRIRALLPSVAPATLPPARPGLHRRRSQPQRRAHARRLLQPWHRLARPRTPHHHPHRDPRMAFLIETPTWEEGIYQWEEDDPVVGGEGGIDNVPTRQLANRTKWLKAQVAALADASQPLSPRLSALAALTLAANQTIYATGSASFAATAITEFARSLIAAASASSARELLGASPLLSPAFTGTPTAPTASSGTNTTQLATTAFVQAAVSALVNSSPGALDTLNELAAALGNDPNFATTITTALAAKSALLSPAFAGIPTAPTAAAGTSSSQIATTAFVLDALSSSGIVGQPGYFRRTTAPPGWLKANGAAVSRTAYAALFAEIGTSEGAGNGSTTFNLPDWRGVFFRGWDDSRGMDPGRAIGSLQDGQNAAHTHSGTTGTESADHSHSGTTSTTGEHAHSIQMGYTNLDSGMVGGGRPRPLGHRQHRSRRLAQPHLRHRRPLRQPHPFVHHQQRRRQRGTPRQRRAARLHQVLRPTTMHIVSQLDHHGYFVGPTVADESPLEPGVYLLPAGAVDVPPPEAPPGHSAQWVDGAWVYAPAAHPAPPAPPAPLSPEQTEARALLHIDQDTDAIYRDAIGLRAPEYEATEREAIAFQAASFEGDPPRTISAWMQASGMTAQDATLDILAQAATWRSAVLQIRTHRLQAKAGVRAGQVEEAMAAWAGFVAQIRADLELTEA